MENKQKKQRDETPTGWQLLGVHVLGCAACAPPPLQTPAEDRSPPTWSRPEPEPVWAANWRQENRRSVGVNRNSLSGYGYRTLQNPFGCETIQASRTHTMVLFAGRSGRKQSHGVPTNWNNLASIEIKHQRHWMARRADATFASTDRNIHLRKHGFSPWHIRHWMARRAHATAWHENQREVR